MYICSQSNQSASILLNNCFTDKTVATIKSKQNGIQANILEECNKEQWNAPERALGEDAEVQIDMICPFRLQEIQIINGNGEFKTKKFSVFVSNNRTGPWRKVITGLLDTGEVKV